MGLVTPIFVLSCCEYIRFYFERHHGKHLLLSWLTSHWSTKFLMQRRQVLQVCIQTSILNPASIYFD